MNTSGWRSIRFKITALFLVFGVVLVLATYVISRTMVSRMEETLIADRLNADINYIEDLIALSDATHIGSGEWNIGPEGGIYLGDILVGDGTHEKANLAPFLEHEEKTGTFSYVFKRVGDEGLGVVESTATAKGYAEGHFLRVAGSTRDPDGNSIVGTYMDVLVADILDAEDTYGGEANVAGGMIYCRYNTLKNADGEVVGAIVVGRNISELQAQVRSVMTTLIVAVILVVTLAVFFILFIVTRWTGALALVTDHIRRIEEGSIPEEPIENTGSADEIGMLISGVNRMTDTLRENEALRIKSETDQLTGLSNRFGLNRRAEEIFERCFKQGLPLTVGIMDIDYFKPYNDHYGHTAGDECIIMLADILREVEEKENICCARFGGDEFVVVCESFTPQRITKMAGEIMERVRERHMPHAYSDAADYVTISQGFCIGVPLPKQRFNDFIYLADGALYDVKNRTKNDYEIVHMTEDFYPSLANAGIVSQEYDQISQK